MINKGTGWWFFRHGWTRLWKRHGWLHDGNGFISLKAILKIDTALKNWKIEKLKNWKIKKGTECRGNLWRSVPFLCVDYIYWLMRLNEAIYALRRMMRSVFSGERTPLLSILRLYFNQLSMRFSSRWWREGPRWFSLTNVHIASYLDCHDSSLFIYCFLTKCNRCEYECKVTKIFDKGHHTT